MSIQPDPDEITVLVVEDERQLADLFTGWLDSEYEVRTAYTGEDARNLYDETVDVVLLDRRLPGVSGDDLLGWIRSEGSPSQVAMVSAVDPDEAMLKLDIDEYVTKPVTREELLGIVDEMARRLVLEADIRRYLALTSKKQTLEAEQTPDSLSSPQYRQMLSELGDHRRAFTETLAAQAQHRKRPEHHYTLREIIGGVVAIALVGAVLVGIHLFYPEGINHFSDVSPTANPFVGYPAALFHLSDAHLYGNVAGFLFITLLTYVLCLRVVAAAWFYLTSIAILLLVPVLTFLFIYGPIEAIGGDIPLLVGFSGIVSAFIGFSFLSLLTALRLVYEPRNVLLVGGVVVFTATTLVLWLQGIGWGLLTAVLTLALFLGLVNGLERTADGSGRDRNAILEATLTACVLGGLYAVLGIGVVAQGDVATVYSIIGHLIGLVLGFVIAFVSALALDLYPIRSWVEDRGYHRPESLL